MSWTVRRRTILYPEEYGIPWHVQNNVAEHAAKCAVFGFGSGNLAWKYIDLGRRAQCSYLL